jgi:hypothetical protein
VLLGDESALPRALELAREDKAKAGDLVHVFSRLGDDGVTSLCLMAEGKYFPGYEREAVRKLREKAPQAALPTLIRCLDHRDGEIRYLAYTAIEKIRGHGRRMMRVTEFLGRKTDPNDMTISRLEFPPTETSQKLIQEMKEWWETEGKWEFHSVLPEEER